MDRELVAQLMNKAALDQPSSESVKVFGCRPFIDLCCPPRQGRRSKTSKEGNRESEGRRRRCDLWGFESRWRLLSSGRNDYQRRFRRIERSEGVFSGGNGIIFSRRPCSRKAPGASLGERRRRGAKRELGCGVAGDAISIMTCRS